MRCFSVLLRVIRLEACGAGAVVEVTFSSTVFGALLAVRRKERVPFGMLLLAVGASSFEFELVSVLDDPLVFIPGRHLTFSFRCSVRGFCPVGCPYLFFLKTEW